MTDWAVWVFAAIGCTVTGAALRAVFAAEIPMSQVMPGTGVAATGVGFLPELNHQPASARLAQSAEPRPMSGARRLPVVATGFCLSLATVDSGQCETINFGDSTAIHNHKAQLPRCCRPPDQTDLKEVDEHVWKLPDDATGQGPSVLTHGQITCIA